jgi:hypothetical protein
MNALLYGEPLKYLLSQESPQDEKANIRIKDLLVLATGSPELYQLSYTSPTLCYSSLSLINGLRYSTICKSLKYLS